MKKPTLFLSSTIYDFRDLRSALKDYFELRGCQVLASEESDFPVSSADHSYQACLKAIEQADFYLLLIGSRVGGRVDGTGVSITRAEYRRAYDLAKTGRLRLLTFVRSEVWDHREARRELGAYLQKVDGLSREVMDQVKTAPTKFMTDAEAIIDFIEEVSRNAETRNAVAGQGEMPAGNWIHQFRTFAEIRRALDPLILGGRSTPSAAGRAALLEQVLLALQSLLPTNTAGEAFFAETAIRNLTTQIGLSASDIGGTRTLGKDLWEKLVGLSIYASNHRAETGALDAWLASELLLDYQPAQSAFAATADYDLLARFVASLRSLDRTSADLNDLVKAGLQRARDEARTVPVAALAAHLGRLNRWADAVLLGRALAASLAGQGIATPRPMPRTPFVDMEDGLAKEAISLEAVRRFVRP